MTDLEHSEDLARGASAGEQLQRARQAAGLDVSQVAAETRIPQRHLVSIEAGEYDKLPSRTYAIGFARTYARLVGLDEVAITGQVREELAAGGPRAAAPTGLQPGDPARVPSRGLAWFALLAAILLGAGIFAFYRSYLSPGMGPPPLSEPSAAPTKPAAAVRPTAAAPVANGPVVFTSEMDGTWVKFYDKAGTRLFEGVMAKGEAFTVPAAAEGPQIRTGRPYAFAITVGGKPVAKLSEKDEIVKDVPVDGASLLARPAAAASPAATLAPASPTTSGRVQPAVTPAPR